MNVHVRRMARPAFQVQQVHGDGADARCRGQLIQQLALGQQQRHAAIGKHVGQALGRITRIQRHIGAAGLDDGQQADQQLGRALGGNRHAHVRPHALVAQIMRQAVGLGVQYRVVQVTAVPHQGDTFRGLQGLLVEQLRQPTRGRRAGRAAPLLLLGLFVAAEQLHVAKGQVRLCADLAQQADKMLGQPRDGGRLEQFVGVVEGQAQAAVAILFAVQLQVELGLAAVPGQLLGEQAGQTAQGTQIPLLVVEHHLEQAALAGFGEGFEQLLERQVLIGLGAERGLAGAGQQVGERRARVQLGAQHQGVDEKTDQTLGFQARAVGTGHADANVGLAAVAVQQTLECRQQQHERRRLVAQRGLAHGLTEVGIQA
ncbi:hypothetical protein D3C85_946770 [compost metagenome]